MVGGKWSHPVKAQAVRQVSKVTTRPASVRGLNSYDSIVAMPAGFALVLRNLYAQPYGCQVRRGYRRWVVGLEGEVETLCSHNLTTGDQSLYAFVQQGSTAAMYDVSTEGLPGVSKMTGLANARWQHLNFPNAAGNHLVAVNGADNMIWVQPNGTILTVAAGDGSLNTIAGVDPKALIHCYSHQKRLWFVEKNSTRGWYLPPGQVYGIAHSFDFGSLWSRGGYLQQIITWTIDDGEGADDHLLAISSEGQVAVYKGTDPDGVDTWGLAGVYYAGAPLGRRCATRFGGDVLILTQLGAVQMSDLLKSTKVNPTQENHFKYVQQLLSGAAGLTGDEFGWQPFIYPGANMVVANIPANASTSYQLVMNDITKAWSEFLGYNAHCWELHLQEPFFGASGAVYQAWDGTTDDHIVGRHLGQWDASGGTLPTPVLPETEFRDGDNYSISVAGTLTLYDRDTGTSSAVSVGVGDTITFFNSVSIYDGWYVGGQYRGNDIRAEVQSTFDYFETFGQQKHFKMVRPTIMSKGAFNISISVNVDFVFDSPLAPASFAGPGTGVWDESAWNAATWSGGLNTYKEWLAVTGIGTAAALRMMIVSSQETYWPSTDWLHEVGGVM
jgi:hypothetical protein